MPARIVYIARLQCGHRVTLTHQPDVGAWETCLLCERDENY